VHRVLRDERWKLMLSPLDVERFFDLRGAQIEGPNLLAGTLTDEQREAYERLKSELARLTGG
jgi:hypothetical protein